MQAILRRLLCGAGAGCTVALSQRFCRRLHQYDWIGEGRHQARAVCRSLDRCSWSVSWRDRPQGRRTTGSAPIQAQRASIRSASDRDAITAWKTIPLMFGRAASNRAICLVGCSAQIIHEARGAKSVIRQQIHHHHGNACARRHKNDVPGGSTSWTELARRTFKRRHGPFGEHAACWKLIGIVPERGTVGANKLGVADNKTAVLRQCERIDLKKFARTLSRFPFCRTGLAPAAPASRALA